MYLLCILCSQNLDDEEVSSLRSALLKGEDGDPGVDVNTLGKQQKDRKTGCHGNCASSVGIRSRAVKTKGM